MLKHNVLFEEMIWLERGYNQPTQELHKFHPVEHKDQQALD
jgi:hypothetical protein